MHEDALELWGLIMLRYICISDLHAGALSSFLVDREGAQDKEPDPTSTSPVTRDFAAAMKTFVGAAIGGATDKPQLVLLGDVVDLQFSDRAHATQNALTFLSALNQTGVFADDVLATAGNHDHALWSDARLALEAEAIPRGKDGLSFRSDTLAFAPTEGADSRLLTALLKEANFGSVDFRYPNIGLQNEKSGPTVVLHHGHFVETPYRLISDIKDAFNEEKRPNISAAELSSENAGWIDFFWSTTGDAGLGLTADRLYQDILTTEGYRNRSKKWAAKIGKALSEGLPMSGNLTLQSILKVVAQVGLDVTVGNYRDTERYAVVDSLTHEGFQGVADYIDGPIAGQIKDEEKGDVEDLTFIFGHTHKPFSDRVRNKSFRNAAKVYNTGGWALNGPRLDNAQGAAVALIDDDLNVALLQVFKTPDNDEVPLAHVEVLADTQGALKFKSQIEDWISASKPEWETLAETAGEAYRLRRDFLLDLTAGDLSAESRERAAR